MFIKQIDGLKNIVLPVIGLDYLQTLSMIKDINHSSGKKEFMVHCITGHT